MFVGALVQQTIQLIHWRNRGWLVRRPGILCHRHLGHVTHNEHCAIAHAPSGRPVAVCDTTNQAVHELTQYEHRPT